MKREISSMCYLKSIVLCFLALLCPFLQNGAFAAELDQIRAGNYAYVILLNDTVRISEYTGKTEDELRIPEVLDGRRVSNLGFAAFNSCRASSVIIPAGVKYLGYQCFIYAGMNTVEIPSSVTEIDSEAFKYCDNLSTVVCARGSYAETWAAQKGYTTVLYDDVSEGEFQTVPAEAALSEKNWKTSSEPMDLYGVWELDPKSTEAVMNEVDSLLIQAMASMADYSMRLTVGETQMTMETTAFYGMDRSITSAYQLEENKILDENGTFMYWRVSEDNSELHIYESPDRPLRFYRLTYGDGSAYLYPGQGNSSDSSAVPAELLGQWDLARTVIRDPVSGKNTKLSSGTMTISANEMSFRDNSFSSSVMTESIRCENGCLKSEYGRVIAWKLSGDGQAVTMIDNMNMVWYACRAGSEKNRKYPVIPDKPQYMDPQLIGIWTLISGYDAYEECSIGAILASGEEFYKDLIITETEIREVYTPEANRDDVIWKPECGVDQTVLLTGLDAETCYTTWYQIDGDTLIFDYLTYARKGSSAAEENLKRLRLMGEIPFGYDTVDGGVRLIHWYGSGTMLNIPGEMDGLRVTEVSGSLLSEQQQIETITIPESIQILEGTFLPNLKEIQLDPGNMAMTLIDGVLFNSDQTVLILYPVGDTRTEYMIPEGTLAVGQDAFHGAVHLSGITFPSGLEVINTGAFRGCASLTAINLPANMKQLSSDAFADCTALREVALGQTDSKSICGEAFRGCSNLEIIHVTPGTGAAVNFESCGLPVEKADYSMEQSIDEEGNLHVRIKEGILPLFAFTESMWLTDTQGKKVILEGKYQRDPFHNAVSWSLEISNGEGLLTVDDPYLAKNKEVPWKNYLTKVKSTVIRGKLGDAITWTLDNHGLLTVSGTGEVPARYEDITIDESYVKMPWTEGNVYPVRQLIISEGITAISEEVFRGTAITNVVIPESVERIWKKAFADCKNLEEVTLPAGITYIADDAFLHCPLTTVHCVPGSYAEQWEYSNRPENKSTPIPFSEPTPEPEILDGVMLSYEFRTDVYKHREDCTFEDMIYVFLTFHSDRTVTCREIIKGNECNIQGTWSCEEINEKRWALYIDIPGEKYLMSEHYLYRNSTVLGFDIWPLGEMSVNRNLSDSAFSFLQTYGLTQQDQQPSESNSPVQEATLEDTEAPTAQPTEEPTPEPTAEPTEEPTPEPTEEPASDMLGSGLILVPVDCVDASSWIDIDNIPDEYIPQKMIDGNEQTAWQFSIKKSKLKKTYAYFWFDTPQDVDELWIKNGFWTVTSGFDQYTRNSRVKDLGIAFQYEGNDEWTDKATYRLKDDKKRDDWQKVSLGRHEHVTGIRFRIMSIYTGEKYPKDVCISEVMFAKAER